MKKLGENKTVFKVSGFLPELLGQVLACRALSCNIWMCDLSTAEEIRRGNQEMVFLRLDYLRPVSYVVSFIFVGSNWHLDLFELGSDRLDGDLFRKV